MGQRGAAGRGGARRGETSPAGMNCFRFTVRLHKRKVHYVIAYLCGFLSVFIGFGLDEICEEFILLNNGMFNTLFVELYIY